jgi:SAM-dependent methyltransferase
MTTIIDRLLPGRKVRRGEQFDRMHGVETQRTVTRDNLTGMPEELRRHAGEYIPTNPVLFRRIVRKSGIDPSKFTFVDLGCGKGRVVIAATEFSFKAIVGIEADTEIFEIARENLISSGRDTNPNIRIEHGDARAFEWPGGNLFIFMYSPFRGEIFEQVAERLAGLASEPDRAIVVAYSSDFEAEILERSGRFTRVRMRRRQFWAPSTVSFFFNPVALEMRR